MTIRRARFVTSLDGLKPYDGQGLPEIAMVGKSNVGKSSLINRLAGNGSLARTSAEPGKTRLINLYAVNEAFLLADLPGYGFARAPKDERAKWARMIEGFLSKSRNLAHALLLVDIRHEPTDEDGMMANYLRHYGIPFSVVATKADKLSKAARARGIPVLCRKLVVQPWEVIPFSSDDGTGRDELLARLEKILDGARKAAAEDDAGDAPESDA